MMNFNYRTLLAGFVSIVGCFGAVRADVLFLDGNDRLDGALLSLGPDGVKLESDLSPEPLVFQQNAVRRIAFSEPENVGMDLPTGRLELVNGDLLAVDIEDFDGDFLTVSTPSVGMIKVPRKVIRTLQVGVYQQKVLFSGAEGDPGWSGGSRVGNTWTWEDDVLHLEGSGVVSKDLDLPSNYVLKFNLHWREQPSIEVSFSDPLVEGGPASDRYFFRFSGSGVEVRREASEGRRYTTIIPPVRASETYPGNQMDVEIQVDRMNGMLHLYLNGEPEGHFRDPIPGIPSANGISINSTRAGRNSSHNISRLEILDWNEASDRYRTEERGDVGLDSMIERRGDRFSGIFEALEEVDGSLQFVFQTDFQDAPLKLPSRDVSTIFFKQDGQSSPPDRDQDFMLRLMSEGFVQVSSCVFDGEWLMVEHPLLGSLKFAKDGVMALERKSIQSGEVVR